MSYTSKGTAEIVVAGLQTSMFTIDVDKGVITKEVGFSASGDISVLIME